MGLTPNPKSWAEVVRKSRKRAKTSKRSSPSRTLKLGVNSLESTPKGKFMKFDDEDLIEMPKSRSLKKRADRITANTARFSITKKSAYNRVSSKKKSSKKKKTLKPREESDYDDEVASLVSAQSTFEKPKSLTIADFISLPAKQEVEKEPEILRWPLIPALKDNDSLLGLFSRRTAAQFGYDTFLNTNTDSVESTTKKEVLKNPGSKLKVFSSDRILKTGLLNLDLLEPCTPENPCILDKIIRNWDDNNVGAECYNCTHY